MALVLKYQSRKYKNRLIHGVGVLPEPIFFEPIDDDGNLITVYERPKAIYHYWKAVPGTDSWSLKYGVHTKKKPMALRFGTPMFTNVYVTQATEEETRAFLELKIKTATDKEGWHAHCVPSGDGTPYGYNYHTHGMERSFNHTNIQIVLPIDFKIAHGLAHTIIAEVKKGKKFEPNVDYSNIMAGGYMVRFINAKECGRSVLRMLLPDKNGKYEGKYAAQLTMLDNQESTLEEDKVSQVD